MAKDRSVTVADDAVIDTLRSRLGFSPSPPPVRSLDVSKEKRPTRARRFKRTYVSNDSRESKEVIKESMSLPHVQREVVHAEQPPDNDQPDLQDDSASSASCFEPSKETHDQAVGQTQEFPSDAVDKVAPPGNILDGGKGMTDLGIQDTTIKPRAKETSKKVTRAPARASADTARKIVGAVTIKNKETAKSAAPSKQIAPSEKTNKPTQREKSNLLGDSHAVEPASSMRKTRSANAAISKQKLQVAPITETFEAAPRRSAVLPVIKKVTPAAKLTAKTSKFSTVPWNVGKETEKVASPLTGSNLAKKPAETVMTRKETPKEQQESILAVKEVAVPSPAKSIPFHSSATMETPTILLPSMPDEFDYSVADEGSHLPVPSSPGRYAALRLQQRAVFYNEDDDDELEYVDAGQSSPRGKKQVASIGELGRIQQDRLGEKVASLSESVLSEKADRVETRKAARLTADVLMQSTPPRISKEGALPAHSSAGIEGRSKFPQEADLESDDEPVLLSARRSSPSRLASKGKTVSEVLKRGSERPKPRPSIQKALPEKEPVLRQGEEAIAENRPEPQSIGNVEPENDSHDPFGFSIVERSVKQRLMAMGKTAPTHGQVEAPVTDVESQTQLEGQFSILPASTDITNIEELRDDSLPPLDFTKEKTTPVTTAIKPVPSAQVQALRQVEKGRSGNETSSDLSDFESDIEKESWGSNMTKKSLAAKQRKVASDIQAGPKTIQEITQFSMTGNCEEEKVSTSAQKEKPKGKGKTPQTGRKLNMNNSLDSSFKIDKPSKGRALEVKCTPTPATTAKSKKATRPAVSQPNARDDDDYDLPPGMTRPVAKKGRASAPSVKKTGTQKKPKAVSSSSTAKGSKSAAGTRPKPRPLAARDSNKAVGGDDDFDFNALPVANKPLRLSSKRAAPLNEVVDDEESQPVTKSGTSRSKKAKVSKQHVVEDDEEDDDNNNESLKQIRDELASLKDFSLAVE